MSTKNVKSSTPGSSSYMGMGTGGGPVVKVSSSMPMIQGPNGSVTLVVSSSNSGGALSLSPNVSVTSTATTGPGSGKRATTNISRYGPSTSTSKDKIRNDSPRDTSGNHQNETKEINLHADLRNIMHAFGDSSRPDHESVSMMESILKQEMAGFVFICDSAAGLSGSKILGLRECIYALRRDKLFLSRLFKHLIFKDQQHRICRINQQRSSSLPLKSFVTEIREAIQELDETGDLENLLDFDMLQDISKSDRPQAHLSDVNTNRLTLPKYINYARARSVSFARKLPNLQEWVTSHLHPECKLSPNFMEILAFVIYELTAQMVDLSFSIKRERMNSYNPLYKLMDCRGSNPDTCFSSAIMPNKDEECNNVSEILVLASELEAKRFKKQNNQREVTRSVQFLSPSEIREAYSRMQKSSPPANSFHSRAEKMRQVNYVQY